MLTIVTVPKKNFQLWPEIYPISVLKNMNASTHILAIQQYVHIYVYIIVTTYNEVVVYLNACIFKPSLLCPPHKKFKSQD